MTLEENLAELEGHVAEFEARRGFTDSVLDPPTDDVIGCVYVYPPRDGDHDARDWPFERVDCDPGA